MTIIFEPGLPLDAPSPFLDGDRALAARVRMVLETRPGDIPWRPDFGCDLVGLIGFPVTPALLEHVRSTVRTALSRWIRDATVVRVEARAVPVTGTFITSRPRTVPTAEAALLALGVQAELEVDVELKGPSGYLSVSAAVMP